MPDPFIKPRYDSGGFASLPQQISHQLTAPGNYDAVVLLLIDGFGWRFFDRFQKTSFFKTISRLGKVEKITAQFPSTTTAQLVTLHTGATVGEHGIFEWNYYEPMLDAVISPLLFSFAGTRERDTLKHAGMKPRRLFPTDTFYHALRKQGITSTIFQHREYTPSSFGDVIFSGAQACGYRTLPEALVNLGEALAGSSPGAYFVLYNDRIDAISHEYGPEAPQTRAEIDIMLMTMEALLLKGMKDQSQEDPFPVYCRSRAIRDRPIHHDLP